MPYQPTKKQARAGTDEEEPETSATDDGRRRLQGTGATGRDDARGNARAIAARQPKGGMSPLADRKDARPWDESPGGTGREASPLQHAGRGVTASEPVGGWVDRSTGRRLVGAPDADVEKRSIELLAEGPAPPRASGPPNVSTEAEAPARPLSERLAAKRRAREAAGYDREDAA